jgi:ParB-like chromosome segregation protein Spo0J
MRKTSQYKPHPYAKTIRTMNETEYAGLVDDIRANQRLVDPIVLLVEGDETLILDGINRERACLEANVEPTYRYFDVESEGDPYRFVISKNLARKHLSAWDSVTAAQRILALNKRERKAANKNQPRLPGVTPATEEMRAAVAEDGTPELVAALDADLFELHEGAALSKLEPEIQQAAVKQRQEQAAEPVKPVRAKTIREGLTYEAGELSPTDIAGLVTLMRIGDKSVHAEAGHGAGVLRRIVPGLGVR